MSVVAPTLELPDTTRVVALDPSDVVTPPGNRAVTPDSVDELLASIQKEGQLVPGIVYAHPENSGSHICVEGNRRLLCCRILGIPFKAVILPRPPGDLDLIRLRLTTNVIRKAMTPDEIAADIQRYMTAATATQEAAAEFFGFSPGYVSKLLAPSRRLLPELRHLADNPAIGRDTLRIIAGLPTAELQKQLAERVQEIIAGGGKVKRDLVERIAAELKGTSRPRRRESVRINKDGASLIIPGDWQWERLAKFLGELTDVVRREARRDGKPVLPISALPQLL